MKRLRVLMTRHEIVPERLREATSVVLDVLLATTTLVTAFDNGARRVYPAESLEESDAVLGSLEAEDVLRGGEQGGEWIRGYELGFYPGEYSSETVAGKDVIFVTTNGTRALADAAPSKQVLVGCLRNAPAIAHYLETLETDSLYLICAGSHGRFTLEDFLGASAILSYMHTEDWDLNDAASMALDLARVYQDREMEALTQSRTGRWFLENDRLEELEFVGDLGASDLVLQVVDGQLRRAPGTG
ncbi:MAG: 2-phosphosulfolactate phosphatase [Rubrobacteraceae bacterium]